MNVPSPSLLVFVGTVRGWRGIMMSSTLVPSSVCFSETWDNSSDLFGENKLQSLHMKMEVIPEKNKFENKELVFSNISYVTMNYCDFGSVNIVTVIYLKHITGNNEVK